VDSADRIYRGSVRVLSFVFVALGLIILARTLIGGGGPLSTGTLLGAVFVAVGIGRLWISGFFRDGTRG
jgi:hypothetical protein